MSVIFVKARQKFLEANINMLTDNIAASLVDSGLYSANLSTDEFVSIVPNNAIIATELLSGKSTTDGVFDANDRAFVGVANTANTVEEILIWKNTGNNETSPVIALVDQANGLPFQPHGGTITVIWDNGTDKIFKFSD